MDKIHEIDKIFNKKFFNTGYAWHSSGENFIAYDVFSKNIKKVQQKVYDISKEVNFYCSPELSIYKNKILVNFFF